MNCHPRQKFANVSEYKSRHIVTVVTMRPSLCTGNKERLVPLPGAFGAVFGFWLKDRHRTEAVFAKANGQPVSAQAARAYLRLMLNKASIEKKISLHKLRHTYATNLLNAGAELVDIKALLGHESIATTQIYTNVGQERMEKVVGRL